MKENINDTVEKMKQLLDQNIKSKASKYQIMIRESIEISGQEICDGIQRNSSLFEGAEFPG